MEGMFENPEHVFPPLDQFIHVPFESCACKPLLDSRYVRGVGGAAWFQHQPMMVPLADDGVDFSVPDVLPASMLYPNDNDPED